MNRRTKRAIKGALVKVGEFLTCAAMGIGIAVMIVWGWANEPIYEPTEEPEQEWEMIRWKQPDTEYDFDYEEVRVTAGVASVIETAMEGKAEVQQNQRSFDWDGDESYLLAKIAMAEAENQDTEGKALVICVVLNRVWSGSFPRTIEEVIFQEYNGVYQFSPIGDGRWDKVEPDADCWAALDMVMRGWDESEGALFFEVTNHNPTWHSKNLKKLFEHQDVTFYTEKDK